MKEIVWFLEFLIGVNLVFDVFMEWILLCVEGKFYIIFFYEIIILYCEGVFVYGLCIIGYFVELGRVWD